MIARVRSALSARWARWVAYTSRRERGTALALFRIATGLALLWSATSLVTADLVNVLWVDVAHGGYRALEGNWLIATMGGATPAVIWTLLTIAILGGVAVTAGIFTRPAALLTAQAWLALTLLNLDVRGSDDKLLLNSLWLLVLADASATHSLRCRLKTGRWTSDALVPTWPRALVILQLVVLYTSTGLHKVSISWTPAGDFSAVYYILQQPSWQRGDMTWLGSIYPLTQIGTATTWLWELTWIAVPLALWSRARAASAGRVRRFVNRLPIRGAYVTIGIAMHGLVMMLMAVGSFSLIVWAYYPCLFRPDELRAARDRVLRFALRREPPPH